MQGKIGLEEHFALADIVPHLRLRRQKLQRLVGIIQGRLIVLHFSVQLAKPGIDEHFVRLIADRNGSEQNLNGLARLTRLLIDHAKAQIRLNQPAVQLNGPAKSADGTIKFLHPSVADADIVLGPRLQLGVAGAEIVISEVLLDGLVVLGQEHISLRQAPSQSRIVRRSHDGGFKRLNLPIHLLNTALDVTVQGINLGGPCKSLLCNIRVALQDADHAPQSMSRSAIVLLKHLRDRLSLRPAPYSNDVLARRRVVIDYSLEH